MADDQRTHGENCYLWDRHHYECALREIERLRAEVARLQHEADAAAERHVTIAETRADIAERELAALRERIEKAVVLQMPSRRGLAEEGPQLVLHTKWAEKHGIAGHRVRLVREEDT